MGMGMGTGVGMGKDSPPFDPKMRMVGKLERGRKRKQFRGRKRGGADVCDMGW